MTVASELRIPRSSRVPDVVRVASAIGATFLAGNATAAFARGWPVVVAVVATSLCLPYFVWWVPARSGSRRAAALMPKFESARRLYDGERLEEAERAYLALFRRCSTLPALQAICLSALGSVHVARGDLERGRDLIEEAWSCRALDRREYGSHRSAVLASLAMTQALLGDTAAARKALERMRPGARDECNAQVFLVEYYVRLRDSDHAGAAELEGRWSGTEPFLSARHRRAACALRAFAAERRALDDAEVASWVVRASPPEPRTLRNLSANWPDLRDFLLRRALLAPESAATSA